MALIPQIALCTFFYFSLSEIEIILDKASAEE